MYAPGSSGSYTYVCYVSALQYLFLRNFVEGSTVVRIPLMHFPTCLDLMPYSKVA